MDKTQVEKVAILARLKLSKDETESITPQLTKILDYVDNLKELDTSSVEPMGQPFVKQLPMSDDEIVEFEDRDSLTAIAPDFSEGFFKVKKIIG